MILIRTLDCLPRGHQNVYIAVLLIMAVQLQEFEEFLSRHLISAISDQGSRKHSDAYVVIQVH